MRPPAAYGRQWPRPYNGRMPFSFEVPPPRSPRHWPTWLGIGALALLARLPWGLQQALGRSLGAVLQWALGKRRRIAKRNLELCFPQLDERARADLLRRHFAALGIAIFEFGRAWWGSVAPQRHGLIIEGMENIEAARANGRGVIVVSGHFTTLEICARLACDSVPLAGMYRPYPQQAMEWAVLRGRSRYAAGMFAKDDVRGVAKHLKRGGLLWYAPDQDPSKGDSVFVPFFGQPAKSLKSTHQLARLSGAAVVMFQHFRRDDGGYTLRFWPAFEHFPSDDADTDTARVIAAIETMARDAPAQYLWIHRRFKRRPDGVSVYD
jgi:KDO2-lipid IV(A) lauroyltransferase